MGRYAAVLRMLRFGSGWHVCAWHLHVAAKRLLHRASAHGDDHAWFVPCRLQAIGQRKALAAWAAKAQAGGDLSPGGNRVGAPLPW